MDTHNSQKIRQLFDDYLQWYASRDDRLTSYFSEDFSGFTGGGDFLVKDRDEWVAITRQDFAQVKDPLRIELKDLAIQSLSDTVAVATGFFHIHLPIEDLILSRETARLVLIFRQEAAGWKISHSSISIPYNLVREGEVYPLQELTERNHLLEEQVAERTLQLSELNSALHLSNEKLAEEIINHKKAEAARQETEAQFRLLAENVSDVVWKMDRDYCFTYISPADERLRGFKADEVVGHPAFELFDEEGIATVKKFDQQRRENERQGIKVEGLTFEARHHCKDGTFLWAEVSATPEWDSSGKVIGFYGVTREITARKQVEDKVRQAQAAAEEANQAKSQFLASISHEIRTPLNSLVGFSTLARTTTDPVKLDQYHSILEQSSLSLMELVNSILDMSKIEAGRMELEAVPFNLRQLVASLEEQYLLLTGQKLLAFRVVMADNVPDWVLGDPIRLRQILANLFSNAVKFTERGEVSCSVTLAEPPAAKSHVFIRFEVRDTGIGMPETAHNLLFRPFRQLDPTITRKYGGSGLGLAIVHSLVGMMQGHMTLKSQEGVGSCFVVELPFLQTEALPEPQLVAPALLAAGTILVVEDNGFNRRLLGDILRSWGQKVVLAEDGWQALQFMEQQRFDLLLLDIRMPGIDGIEVARRIRRLEQERSQAPVPIIAISADADAPTREACSRVGINAVLAKPVIPEQLATAIALHCGGTVELSAGEGLLLNVQTCVDLGNNPERARQYRSMLLQDIGDELRALQVALDSDDRNELGNAAHTLKGLCGHLANREPAEQAAWLQRNASSANSDELRQVFALLVQGQLKNQHTKL